MYPDTQGLSYPMYPYPTDSEAYFLGNEPSIKVEYTGSSTLDDRDRRRKRSALVKEKEALSNMHMVSIAGIALVSLPHKASTAPDIVLATPGPEPSFTASLPGSQREAR